MLSSASFSSTTQCQLSEVFLSMPWANWGLHCTDCLDLDVLGRKNSHMFQWDRIYAARSTWPTTFPAFSWPWRSSPPGSSPSWCRPPSRTLRPSSRRGGTVTPSVGKTRVMLWSSISSGLTPNCALTFALLHRVKNTAFTEMSGWKISRKKAVK